MSTLSNYARKIAHISQHFQKLPQNISEKEINRYLADLARKSKTPSLSQFKHTIYGLRYCYHLLGMNEKVVKLPSLRQERKLPVVLNYQECVALFKAPELLKHRVLLALIYSAGLRAQEASHLKIGDIDSGRMMIHIRQSKYRKDRYVPLSPLILKGLRKYYYSCQPVEYLFNGHEPGTPFSVRGMQWTLREAVKKCKLQKGITLHTLRHSYATHLLEFGMDILSIKELLGHERIDTTMIYLHVAKPRRTNLFSPLDRLYEKA
jgi:site-specific recombinase XerD